MARTKLMKLSFYIDYFTRVKNELKALSLREGIFLPYLYWDFAKASIVHGAILNHYVRGQLYKLKGCERRKSLTYRRILKTYERCNDKNYIPTLNNKHLFNAHFHNYVKRGWLYSQEMNFGDFNALCDRCSTLIVKPEDGVEGFGIRKCHPPQGVREREALYKELVSISCMIEECIVQHPGMVFNNTSVNTVRAHSMIDANGEVHILKMLLRAGVGDTVVDNYASGGCVYELDIKSGHIISPSLKKNGEEVSVHPGSDIYVLGRQVPMWDEVVNTVKSAHKELPQCRFIGWDVAITPTGIELIEGNHNPDYELFEFFGTKGWWSIIKKYL